MSRHHAPARYILAVGLLAVAGGLGALWPLVVSDYWIGIGIELLKWIALTQSWVLISGLTGYISLGHVAFYGLGGYVTVLLWPILGVWGALPVAALAAAAAALPIGWQCLRVKGPYFVILTFGVAEFLKFAVIAIEDAIGSFGRLLMGGPSLAHLFHILLGLALVSCALTWLIGRSRFGAGLVAVREDETAAETIGVPTSRLKLIAYVLSALIPAMVGGVMALRTPFFDVSQAFNPVVSFTIVTIAIIGGAGGVWGPILGSLFLVTLHTALWSTLEQLYMMILGALLIGFVMFLPGGLTGIPLRAPRRTASTTAAEAP